MASRNASSVGAAIAVPVQVSIIGEGKGEQNCYYGWQDSGKYDQPPSMIYPYWTTFVMCFGGDVFQRVIRGYGRILQLSVQKVEENGNGEVPAL